MWKHLPSRSFLKTSLFMVHFSKRYLKTPWWTFLMKNQPQTDAFVAFVKSLPSVPSTSFLLTTAWLKSLQQCFWFTLLLCSRVSYNGILQWFIAIQNCYSRGSLNLTEHSFLLEQPVRVFKKILFRNNQKKIPRKTKIVAPNLSNISEENVCDGIRLIFSDAEGFVCFLCFQ